MPDSKTFDREGVVKRGTDVGLTLSFAEFFANECVQTVALLRGQGHVPPSASAE